MSLDGATPWITWPRTRLPPQVPSVGFAAGATSLSVQEGDGTATLTVQLSAAAAKQVTVAYAATPGTATSSDYTLAAGTLRFAAGETRKVGARGVKE